jgi:hypothetical protein
MHKSLITLTPSLKIASQCPAHGRISPLVKVNRAATFRERNPATKLLGSVTLPLALDLVPFSETYGKPRKGTETYGKVRKLTRYVLLQKLSPKCYALLRCFTLFYALLRLKFFTPSYAWGM